MKLSEARKLANGTRVVISDGQLGVFVRVRDDDLCDVVLHRPERVVAVQAANLILDGEQKVHQVRRRRQFTERET